MDQATDPTADRGYNKVGLPLGRIVMNNFLGGIAWGFGTVIGATIVVGALIWALSHFGILTNLSNNLVQGFVDSFQHGLNSIQIPTQ